MYIFFNGEKLVTKMKNYHPGVKLLCVFLLVFNVGCNGFTPAGFSQTRNEIQRENLSRRVFVSILTSNAILSTIGVPSANALSLENCMKDCMKECALIAPKDTAYCTDQCDSFCKQSGEQR